MTFFPGTTRHFVGRSFLVRLGLAALVFSSTHALAQTDQAEVVVDGVEMPASIFPWKNSLYLTSVGKLERWSDEDGDGKFEQRTILADGFCGFYHHWLSGMVLNADGWFYLTAGDNDNHVVGSDGSRVEISRCGGVFRGRVDGSKMNFFAMGFRNP